MRSIDPDTAQEYIDDARREAERCADVAIADLKAEVEDLRAQVKELEPLRPLWEALRLSRSAPLVQADAPWHDCVRITLYVDALCGEPALAALKAIALKIDSLLPVEVTE